jgi:peptidoglycan/LPS O-acetylase OafA/YrhL
MNATNFLNSLQCRFDKAELNRLDSWRGFLAFVVMIAHANQIFILPIIGIQNYTYWGFGVLAHFCVLGFFVISGISITMSLVLNIIRNNNELNFREYIFARISRIHPPLIFSILLCFVFYLIMLNFNLLGVEESFKLASDKYVAREFYIFNFKDAVTTFFFIDSGLVKINGPLWSLIIEWWIYFLVIVFLGIFFVRSYLKKVLLILLFFVIFNKVKHSGLVYLILWLIGSMYYLIGNRFSFPKNLLFLISLLILFISDYNIKFVENMKDVSTLPSIQVLFGIFFISILLKFPKKSVFNTISKFSYSIYIIHFPLFLFVFSVFHRKTYDSLYLNIILAIISIFIVLFVTSKTYLVIEDKKRYYTILNNWMYILQKRVFRKIT